MPWFRLESPRSRSSVIIWFGVFEGFGLARPETKLFGGVRSDRHNLNEALSIRLDKHRRCYPLTVLFGKVQLHRDVVGLLDAQTHQVCRLTEELLGVLVWMGWGCNNLFYGLLERLRGTLGCGQAGSGNPSRLDLHRISLLLGVTRGNQDYGLAHILLELRRNVLILSEIHMGRAINDQFDNA